ncbi:PASTA domain-containing protein [Micromonospora schwarzwaldensis]|uniref:PASTA domain-containing protein n=1 Tax=Micromonospora sp. DSM 45708 TaxID=3111767 RepID=UPI0031CFBCC3
MSDDRQEPPADDADATRALPPDRSPGGDVDATRAMPRNAAGSGEDVDATRAMPRNAAGAGGDADATRPLPGGAPRPLDATSRQEPVGGAAWSGRAGVPPPRSAAYPEPGAEWYGDEQAGRRWWMPILLGVLALILVGLIAAGVWLALRAADRDSGPGTPSAAPSASAPASATSASATPTSASPSSSPSGTPPTTAVEVPMPPLVGLPESAARTVLDRLGVDYRVQRRPSDRPAGTVLATDPEAGYAVGEGERVTLVVAAPAAPTTGAPTTAASTPGSAPTTSATP